MKDNITTIEWFQVAVALPCPGKPVLVSNGGVASISQVEYISVHPDGKGWDVTWKDGLTVIKWSFLQSAGSITSPKRAICLVTS